MLRHCLATPLIEFRFDVALRARRIYKFYYVASPDNDVSLDSRLTDSRKLQGCNLIKVSFITVVHGCNVIYMHLLFVVISYNICMVTI